MKCSGWRFGLSPVIWPSIRDPKERPRGGTDCTSRKCVLPSGIVRRYTVCRVPRHPHPRVRVYDDSRMVTSMTVSSFDEGQKHVDRMIGSGGFGAVTRWLSPERMRCGTFVRVHGREAENYVSAGHLHLDRECNTAQAQAMLDGATVHRREMLAKARECEATGKAVDRTEVARTNRALTTQIRSLQTRLRRPCTPKHAPYEPLDLPAIKEQIRRSQAARAKGK